MTEDTIGGIISIIVNERLLELLNNGKLDLNSLQNEQTLNGIVSQMHIHDLLDRIADDGKETIEAIMYEKSAYLRICDDEFLSRINKLYYKAFAASDALHLVVYESAQNYKEYAVKHCDSQMIPMFNAQMIIHARAIQIYQEIICLVKNGFADGAFARWRSLHELCAVSAFIRKFGVTVAEQYLKYIQKDSSDNGWAKSASCFSQKTKKQRISINEIIRESGIDYVAWQKDYKLGHSVVHANPNTTYGRLGLPDKEPHVLLIGRSNYNLGKAAINAAISLVYITSIFFTIETMVHYDSLVASMTFSKWVDYIAQRYKEINESCFAEYLIDKED